MPEGAVGEKELARRVSRLAAPVPPPPRCDALPPTLPPTQPCARHGWLRRQTPPAHSCPQAVALPPLPLLPRLVLPLSLFLPLLLLVRLPAVQPLAPAPSPPCPSGTATSLPPGFPLVLLLLLLAPIQCDKKCPGWRASRATPSALSSLGLPKGLASFLHLHQGGQRGIARWSESRGCK